MGFCGGILLAKQEGHIASASIELSKLIESGFRVSADVRAIAPKLGCHSASKPNFLGETC
jgi:predicted nucleic acid-binding protein